MKELKAGDYFRDFTGPLGNASELVEEDIEELKKKKILFVGGGVGAAPVYPQVKWLHEHGVDADVIIGSKTKDMLILEKRWKQYLEIIIHVQMMVLTVMPEWLRQW